MCLTTASEPILAKPIEQPKVLREHRDTVSVTRQLVDCSHLICAPPLIRLLEKNQCFRREPHVHFALVTLFAGVMPFLFSILYIPLACWKPLRESATRLDTALAAFSTNKRLSADVRFSVTASAFEDLLEFVLCQAHEGLNPKPLTLNP